jgi:GntR family transcriptional regulator, transcriptional repressor for pyruvate dehydrogenase complex
MLVLKPIRQFRASGEILSQLKEAILRGVFKTGDKLPSERELTETFQVSRGVVREAIRALEATNFVTIRQGPAGGAYVNELNFDRLSGGFLDLYLANKLTIPELNQVRLHVEPEVARLAALRTNEEYCRRLHEAVHGEWGPFGSHDERMSRRTELHFILAEMCGNYLFEGIVNAMIKLTHQIVAAVDPEDHEALHSAGEHDSIAEAVMKGDPEKASKAMTKHLRKFSKSLLIMDEAYRGLAKR